jgi:protein N-terminal amidase
VRSPSSPGESTARYNSAVLVSPEGDVLANYRKSFLFTTDESWAEEGPSGFFSGEVPGGLGRLAMGICLSTFAPQTPRALCFLALGRIC